MHPRKGVRQHDEAASRLACKGIDGILDIGIAVDRRGTCLDSVCRAGGLEWAQVITGR